MGPESKIMMNAKKPPTKISNVQKKMNLMLYSVIFLLINVSLGFCLSAVTYFIVRNFIGCVDPEASSQAYLSQTDLWCRSRRIFHQILDVLGGLLASDTDLALCRAGDD